jgi:hypothetical protein
VSGRTHGSSTGAGTGGGGCPRYRVRGPRFRV